jgi:hypothetical protein
MLYYIKCSRTGQSMIVISVIVLLIFRTGERDSTLSPYSV